MVTAKCWIGNQLNNVESMQLCQGPLGDYHTISSCFQLQGHDNVLAPPEAEATLKYVLTGDNFAVVTASLMPDHLP
jgi:hypothetical protein